MELKELLKNDLLKQIYYGEICLSRESPDTPEYRKTLQKMKNNENLDIILLTKN